MPPDMMNCEGYTIICAIPAKKKIHNLITSNIRQPQIKDLQNHCPSYFKNVKVKKIRERLWNCYNLKEIKGRRLQAMCDFELDPELGGK